MQLTGDLHSNMMLDGCKREFIGFVTCSILEWQVSSACCMHALLQISTGLRAQTACATCLTA